MKTFYLVSLFNIETGMFTSENAYTEEQMSGNYSEDELPKRNNQTKIIEYNVIPNSNWKTVITKVSV